MSGKKLAEKNNKTSRVKDKVSVKNTDISTTQYNILKIIACISMTIDHTAHFFQEQCKIPPATYVEMRYIGRIAFPLFAYLIVESFRFTQNRKKHLMRIGILALVSELPFDVVFLNDDGVITFSHQNVCVTLFLAFLCLMVVERCKNTMSGFYDKHGMKKTGRVVDVCFIITVVGTFAVIAEVCKADYGFSGILFAALVYLSRDKKYSYLFLALAFALFGVFRADIANVMVVVPFILICLFENHHRKNKNIKKGEKHYLSDILSSKAVKRLLGIYYPIHLCILIVIRFIMTV